MKYEILRDKTDLLVLVVNGIVILVSRDMSEVVREIQEDYENRKNKVKRIYEPAVIHTNDTEKQVMGIELAKSNDKKLDTRNNWDRLLEQMKNDDKSS